MKGHMCWTAALHGEGCGRAQPLLGKASPKTLQGSFQILLHEVK
jgi:hypothetical protein